MYVECPKNVLLHLYNRAVEHWDFVDQWQHKESGSEYYENSLRQLTKCECLVEEIEHMVAFSIGGGVPKFDRTNHTLQDRLISIKKYLEKYHGT